MMIWKIWRGGKRLGALCLSAILLLGLCTLTGAAEAQTLPGDVNGDGAVDLRDMTALERWLSPDWEQEIRAGNADVNADRRVDEQDLRDLCLWLLGDLVPAGMAGLPDDLAAYACLSTERSEAGVEVRSFRYGESSLGRDLVCWCLTAGDWDRTVLLNFEIHGFEDAYARDGQLLVDLGEAVIRHFADTAGPLSGCRLLVIPSANPDGLAEGTTNKGFGRCNAQGIDLNRDFDASHIVYTEEGNRTESPFSAVESRAMRDLVLRCRPDVVMDLHGWENCTIGSSALAETFSLYAGLNHKKELTQNAHGYFSYWAQLQGAEALLVEFAAPDDIPEEGVFTALEAVLAGEYGFGGSRQPDPELTACGEITAFLQGGGRQYVQRAPGESGEEYGWIGPEDECRIRQIYADGWCKVLYPVGSLTKTGFCPVSAFLDTEARVEPRPGSVPVNTGVYADPALTRRIGSVWSTDSFTVLAERPDALQIVFPLDSGGWKLGWIPRG